MANAGRLVVDVVTDTSGFTSGLNFAGKKVDRFKSKTNGAALALKGLRVAAVAAASATALGAVVKRSIETADAIGKTADAVALTTDAYQELSFAAGQSGVQQSQLNSNLTAFVKRVGEARAGTGPLVSFLQKYDQTLLGAIQRSKSQEEALNLIAEATKNAKSATDQAAIANAAFSRAGVGMVNLLREGAGGMEDLRAEAREAGLVIREDLIRQAEDANDAFEKLGLILSTGTTNAVLENAEAFEDLANAFIKIVQFGGEALSTITKITDFTGKMVGALVEGDVTLGDIFTGEAGAKIERMEQRFKKLGFAVKSTNEELGKTNNITKGPEGDDSSAKIFDIEEARQRKAAQREEELKQEKFKRDMERAAEEKRLMEETRQNNFNNFRDGLLSEEQLEVESFERRRDQFDEFNQLGLIKAEELNSLRQSLEEQHWERMRDIRASSLTDIEKLTQKSWDFQAATVLGRMAQMTQGVAQQSKVMFEINKAAAFAQGALSLKATVLDAYRWGTSVGGPVVGAAFAAVAGAAQLANLSAIASSSFGGGGGGVAPSQSGTGATSVTSTVPSSTTGTTIIGSEEPQFKITVLLDGQAIIDTIGRASKDGRLIIDAQAVA